MPKPKIYTDEELKQRKKEYDIYYQKKRYNEDIEFREKKKERTKIYRKPKEIKNI
jgi:hypothetical protein